MYYIYMLRCSGGVLYSGITTDFERRFREHCGQMPNGAKYTASHRPLGIASLWQTADRSDAMKLEYRLKKLSKTEKESLVSGKCLIDDYLSEKLDCSAFLRIDIPDELKSL